MTDGTAADGDAARDPCDRTTAEDWIAGTATRSITPDASTWMAGFGFRDGPSEGVELDLRASALALEDRRGTRMVLISAEVLVLQRQLRDAVVERCAEAYDLDPESVFLNATHTHCGPEYREYKIDMQADDPAHYRRRAVEYRARLEDALVAVVGEALEDRSPASLRYDHARCGFAMSRRRPTESGIEHVPYPDGSVDHDVPVLTVRNRPHGSTDGGEGASAGPVRAIVFGYACHTTTVLRCDGWKRFHGDWAGYARQYLEEAYPEATVLFLQGFAGDQNAYPRGSLELARNHGRSMANAVRVGVEAARTPVRGPLRTVFAEHPISFEAPPSREVLETMRDADDPIERVRARELLAELGDSGSIPTERSLPVHGIGFGSDLTLVGLGGEVLVEYSIRLKAEVDGHLWTAGYTNAGFTYVPTERALYEGGYEGGEVIRYTTFPGPPTPDIEERVLGRARTVIDRVSGP